MQSHKQLVNGIVDLAKKVQANKQLSALIRRKFAIKCTTGYSLNALVDFPVSDPIEIIKRLMIGSEGTLGFVSRATYNTVPEWPHKVCYRCPRHHCSDDILLISILLACVQTLICYWLPEYAKRCACSCVK